MPTDYIITNSVVGLTVASTL